jgi:hypothetical protein
MASLSCCPTNGPLDLLIWPTSSTISPFTLCRILIHPARRERMDRRINVELFEAMRRELIISMEPEPLKVSPVVNHPSAV